MSLVNAALCCFIAHYFVYRFHTRFPGRRIFALDPLASTPALDINDGVVSIAAPTVAKGGPAGR